MQAVILCGGRGERLMPMTACTPAALLRILGKNVLSYTLDQLKKAGFKEATLALGYLGGQVIEEFESCEYKGIKLYFTSAEQTGTAPAVAYAAKNGEDILVCEANCVFDFDLNGIIDYHRAKKSEATFVTRQEPQTNRHICFAIDKNNMITSSAKYPSAENTSAVHAFTGVYVLSSGILENYDFNSFADVIEDAVPQMISDGCKIYTYGTVDFWHKITDAQGFLDCQKNILEGKTGLSFSARQNDGGIYTDTLSNFSGVSIVPPAYIGRNVVIESGTVIEPGSVIDDGAYIEKRVRISGAYVGKGAYISSRCELMSCVVCAGARLMKSASCGENSVVGERSRIGEGAGILDGVKIWAGKEVAHGSVVGENVRIGMGKPAFIDDDCSYGFDSCITLPSDTARFGMAVGTAMDIGEVVVAGWSGGPSAEALCSSFIAGLLSSGITVFDLGECTAQQVMFAVNRLTAKLGCFAAADYSEKIKLMERGGLPLKRETEHKIEEAFNRYDFRQLSYHSYGRRLDMRGVGVLYEMFLRDMLPAKFNGVNAEIRTSDAKTARISEELFHSRNDIDGERIVFHLSPDGSSCSAYNDKTGYVFHERLVLLAMKIAYEKKIPVSIPYSFPMGADSLAEEENGRLYRYYNCSDSDEDEEARKVAKRPDNFFVRDGLVLAVMILSYLSEKGITLSDAAGDIPRFYTTQRFVSVNCSPGRLIKEFTLAKSGGSEGVVYQGDESRAVIRPLKSGSGIMIFAESFRSETACSLCDEIQQKIKAAEDQIRK
ncbi:sugar phosphate nucleotidyltransferase [Ruminococcus sp. Marseille-P6503]|uniref:sugar phosphate nucleotidyltransferase n=1 Tax=Ruminococcus sp. Marseille-P6503 TaxID=2364796 RepID=UPI000F53BA54|nr:sugar phosphate nucleotidyltransferase [Ruminococcus sp. Marseille-P6503]